MSVSDPIQSIQTIHAAQTTVNDEYVTVVECLFKTGDYVKKGNKIIIVETSKMVQDFFAEIDGYVEYLCGDEEEVEIGKVLLHVHEQLDSLGTGQEDVSEQKDDIESKENVLFSKKALKLIEEHNIDKDVFEGKEFVTEKEVQALIDKKPKKTPPLTLESLESSDQVKFQKINSIKKREIESLLAVQSSTLGNMVSTFINVTDIFDIMQDNLKLFKGSLLPVILPHLPELLNRYPDFNAFFKQDHIGYYKEAHIGFAINLGDGLRVLHLPDMTNKKMEEAEMEIFALIKRYLDGSLTKEDLAPTTFTISDLSNEGITFFIPLINKDQSAILGISAIDEQLMRCHISISFDHRVTDGKRAAEFLKALKKKVETQYKQ